MITPSSLGIIGFTLGLFGVLFDSLRKLNQLPHTLHWAGRRDQIFSKLRACIRELFAGFTSYESGYAKV